MIQVNKYHLPPTALIPNSPRPLLHYPGYFPTSENGSARHAHETFLKNGWETQWIFRYGQTQRSHYHSGVHECMAVLSGTATIRFGVADTSEDMDENTFGDKKEQGGIELEAKAGDVFVLPAGTAHKTYNTQPSASFTLLTPGDGHHIAGGDVIKALEETENRLSGFTMIGAYPIENAGWNSQRGGEDTGAYERVWSVPKPSADPVLGDSSEGLQGLWD
ncbi:hypothetical protein N7456_000382 [Penicillium angulare]|uniref:Cupin type-1 domain-containing protein n=1 Tax=Penicillium angulare TaxID=116970 RepID=A0A9W9GC19_9EURO|nr:hypothetical protein N7456_000382 [Penicillium angulare]